MTRHCQHGVTYGLYSFGGEDIFQLHVLLACPLSSSSPGFRSSPPQTSLLHPQILVPTPHSRSRLRYHGVVQVSVQWPHAVSMVTCLRRPTRTVGHSTFESWALLQGVHPQLTETSYAWPRDRDCLRQQRADVPEHPKDSDLQQATCGRALV